MILEADLSMELREWYLKAVKQFGWSKSELIEKIAANAHEMIVFARQEEEYSFVEKKEANKFVRNLLMLVVKIPYTYIHKMDS